MFKVCRYSYLYERNVIFDSYESATTSNFGIFSVSSNYRVVWNGESILVVEVSFLYTENVRIVFKDELFEFAKACKNAVAVPLHNGKIVTPRCAMHVGVVGTV